MRHEADQGLRKEGFWRDGTRQALSISRQFISGKRLFAMVQNKGRTGLSAGP